MVALGLAAFLVLRSITIEASLKAGATTRLFGIDTNDLDVSEDGGRTWTTLGSRPTYPMTGFAASADGSIIYAGATDGLFRSTDGGRSWAKTGYGGPAFAVATSADGQVVALVSRATEFFRSSDGGSTWLGPG